MRSPQAAGGPSPWLIGNIVVPALLSSTLDTFVSGNGFEYPDTVFTQLTSWSAPPARDRSELDTERVRPESPVLSDDREAQANDSRPSGPAAGHA